MPALNERSRLVITDLTAAEAAAFYIRPVFLAFYILHRRWLLSKHSSEISSEFSSPAEEKEEEEEEDEEKEGRMFEFEKMRFAGRQRF
jgi:hypothetical protein